MTAQTDLAALLGSRICHDLISPLGAIGNGVELLMLDGGPPRPEIALIAESVAAANARLRFLRVAVGAGSEAEMGLSEIAGLLAETHRGGRIAVDWQVPGPQPRRAVKRAFLMLMCLQGTLPSGGTITVGYQDGHWRFDATGRRLRVEEEFWAPLAGAEPVGPMGPPQVQFALMRAELLRGPGPALVSAEENRLRVSYPG